MTDDGSQIAEVSRQLAAIDIDTTTAEQIARRARPSVATGQPSRRFIEPILVAVFVASLLAWALFKVLEVW